MSVAFISDEPAIYTVERERYAEVVEDIKPLIQEHWSEIALFQDDIDLDPDFELYALLDQKDAMAIYTVRHDRMLVGYAIYFIRPHLHYRKHKWAVSDIILVKKEHRNLGLGTQLFDVVEPGLKALGVDVMVTMTKVRHPQLAMLLEMRGHERAEVNLVKRL